MSADIPEEEKSYVTLVKENFVTNVKFLPIILIGFCIIYWLQRDDIQRLASISVILGIVVGIVVVVLPMNAVVGALYTYLRVRDPRYRKKQEAYKRYREEQERKKHAQLDKPSDKLKDRD